MFVYIVAAVVALVVVAVVWGVLHLRHSQRVATAAVQSVCMDQVAPLREECERVFREAFGEVLSLDKLEESAQMLSGRLDNHETLKSAFAKPDFYWYFVLPVGAYLGELLRVHAKGQWSVSEGGGLEMRVPVGSEVAVTYPFDKVFKQVTIGDRGDIYAYLMSATHLEEALSGLTPEAKW